MQRWPSYFLPSPAPPNANADALRFPVMVLDLLYLQGNGDLIAVLACEGGLLAVVEASAFASLSAGIQTQITTAMVQQRGRFRVLHAHELYISTLDAVEHATTVTGLNDPVYVYGSMQACVTRTEGQRSITPLACKGRSVVGRLDLADTYTLSMQHRFALPTTADDAVYHVLLPLAHSTAIVAGEGLALFYPLPDPAHVIISGNTFALLHIIYDLLMHMQGDLRHENPQHPFTNTILPVPSRRRLEADLQADGYVIRGDVAVRQGQSNADGGFSFLSRLRALAEEWLGPRLTLPPQATPETYLVLIEWLLPMLRTPDDQAMRAVLHGSTSMRTSAATPGPGSFVSGSSAPYSSAGQPTIRLTPPPTQVSPSSMQPQVGAVRTDNWAHDFGVTATRTPSPHVTTSEEWLSDMQAEQSSGPAVPGAPDRTHAWEHDFVSPPPPRANASPNKDDWSDDFA